jgi:hypothetical protein
LRPKTPTRCAPDECVALTKFIKDECLRRDEAPLELKKENVKKANGVIGTGIVLPPINPDPAASVAGRMRPKELDQMRWSSVKGNM